MSKKDKKDEKPKRPKKEVYILQATYKDNDPDTIGAYDSMRAMMRGFAKSIADDIINENRINGSEEVGYKIAKTLADLIPAFFDHDYARDDEGYIRYGMTTYGYEAIDVESVEEENEEYENEEVEED